MRNHNLIEVKRETRVDGTPREMEIFSRYDEKSQIEKIYNVLIGNCFKNGGVMSTSISELTRDDLLAIEKEIKKVLTNN